MILAMDKNNLVGRGNDLPWNYPEDLKYFKKITLNKDVFMGYNTYLSIVNRIGKPLPKRNNYVLTFENELPLGGIIVKDVDSFFENQGIGSKLIKHAIEQLGCDVLWVLEKNIKAIRFYQRHGFVITEEKQYEEGTTEYIVKMQR
jgi:ribosomal protein S18 acetylase RimI-like enzyme